MNLRSGLLISIVVVAILLVGSLVFFTVDYIGGLEDVEGEGDGVDEAGLDLDDVIPPIVPDGSDDDPIVIDSGSSGGGGGGGGGGGDDGGGGDPDPDPEPDVFELTITLPLEGDVYGSELGIPAEFTVNVPDDDLDSCRYEVLGIGEDDGVGDTGAGPSSISDCIEGTNSFTFDVVGEGAYTLNVFASNTATEEVSDNVGFEVSLNTGGVCGDEVIDSHLGEECDDGNVIDGDGCSSVCENEIVVTNCQFTSAIWGATQAMEGNSVDLVLVGQDCSGEEALFEIYEVNGAGADSIVKTISGESFVTDIITTPWTVPSSRLGTGGFVIPLILEASLGFLALGLFTNRRGRSNILIILIVLIVILSIVVIAVLLKPPIDVSLAPEVITEYNYIATLVSDPNVNLQSDNLQIIRDVGTPGDSDGDGILDENDNCPLIANAGQEDLDFDNAGNACDNCELNFNVNQLDSDNDGSGDVCDASGIVDDNTLGTVTVLAETCSDGPGNLPGSVCRHVQVSCPNVPDITAKVRITEPALAGGESVRGTIIFGTGSEGTGWWGGSQSSPAYGALLALTQDDGYRTVQRAWDSAWQTGTGGTKALSCRYATLADWVQKTYQEPGTAFCATGNSGGGGEIAYSLTRWNGADMFDQVVFTGGHPFARMDLACGMGGQDWLDSCVNEVWAVMSGTTCPVSIADAENYCIKGGTAALIDSGSPEYGNACADHDVTYTQEFLEASVLSPNALYSYPNTRVDFFEGLDDCTTAIPSAILHYAVTEDDPNTATSFQTFAGVGHNFHSSVDGANAIHDSLVTNCVP